MPVKWAVLQASAVLIIPFPPAASVTCPVVSDSATFIVKHETPKPWFDNAWPRLHTYNIHPSRSSSILRKAHCTQLSELVTTVAVLEWNEYCGYGILAVHWLGAFALIAAIEASMHVNMHVNACTSSRCRLQAAAGM